MRYAQIVMGLKGNGKSTYCKLMAKYAESRGRKMRIVNLDPSPGVLVYDQPIADIRDQINLDECNKSDDTSSGFEYILNYILEHPEWLFGAIGEVREGDYFIFDCPGETEFHAHLNVLKVFAAMLVVKNFRTCVVFIRDSRLATNGYSYIGSCLTPLVSYVSLSLPHVNVMMKIDMLSDEDKSRLHLFINSDIRDVLRYENNKRGSADRELAQSAGIASIILDGHNLVRKKYFPIDIREEQHFKTFLSILDDVMGIITED